LSFALPRVFDWNGYVSLFSVRSKDSLQHSLTGLTDWGTITVFRWSRGIQTQSRFFESCAGDLDWVGDIDSDGDDDLVVLPGESRPCSGILRNDGQGLMTAEPLPAEALPGAMGKVDAVLLVDLNRDGHSDLVLSRGGSLEVRLRRSDSSYPLHAKYSGASAALASADLNRDGLADVVGSRVYLGLGAAGVGTGAFKEGSKLSDTAFDRVEVADFNGDGFGDVLGCTSHQYDPFSRCRVFLNDRLGAFTTWLNAVDDQANPPGETRSAQIDGDAAADLIWLGSSLSSSDRRHLKLRRGPLDEPSVNAGYVGPGENTLMFDAFRSACRRELVMNTSESGVALLPADDDGQLLAPLQRDIGTQPIRISDLDQDGRGDALSPSGVYLSKAAPFDTPLSVGAHAAADLDGDGDQDLVLGSSGKLEWLENDQWSFRAHPVASGHAYTTLAATGDFDGDGRSDIVANLGSTSLAAFHGQGGGAFLSGNKLENVAVIWLGAADTDGDGTDEILAAADGSVLLLRAENRALQMQTRRTIPGLRGCLLADSDGDGEQDLMCRTYGELIVVMRLRGGEFEEAAAFHPSQPLFSFTVADFDGDGRSDVAGVVMRPYYNVPSELAVFRNLGDRLSEPTLFTTVSGSNVSAGDVDGDGLADLALTPTASDETKSVIAKNLGSRSEPDCGECGDGQIAGLEGCDPGTLDAPGCTGCQITSGWSCSGAPSVCHPVCGDGLALGDEQCDDGNRADGDGCDTACELENGWTCSLAPFSACEPICGDGVRRGDEVCDDGNRVPDDGCPETCRDAEWAYAYSPVSEALTLVAATPTQNAPEAADEGFYVAGRGIAPASLEGSLEVPFLAALGADGRPRWDEDVDFVPRRLIAHPAGGFTALTQLERGELSWGDNRVHVGRAGETCLVRVSGQGELEWHRCLGESVLESHDAVRNDAGSVTLLATYQGALELDGAKLADGGSPATCLLAFDGLGAIVQGQSFGAFAAATAVTRNAQGDLAVAGRYWDGADFGFGALPAAGGHSGRAFVAVFDPALDPKHILYPDEPGEVAALALDESGGVTLLGVASPFGLEDLPSTATRQSVRHYSATGTHLWTRTLANSTGQIDVNDLVSAPSVPT
jgi:cysteine-rich repeat protein